MQQLMHFLINIPLNLVKEFEIKIDKFKREKKLVMMRAQYNILVQSMRK